MKGESPRHRGRAALEAGADNVVVGTAITGVDLQVQAYCQGMKG